MTSTDFCNYLLPKINALNNKAFLVYKIFIDFFGEDKVDFKEGVPPVKSNVLLSIYNNNLLRHEGFADVLKDNKCPKASFITQKACTKFCFWDKEDLDKIPDYLWEFIIYKELEECCWTNVAHAASIIVWFPEVTITNEYGRSTVVKDLYIKTLITFEGKPVEDVTGLRTTFTKKQLLANYTHSHILPLDIGEPTEFSHFCLGTGPINNVIYELKKGNYFDEVSWGIYCYELNRLVGVESIAGVPYIRLDNLNNNCVSNIYMDRLNFCSRVLSNIKFFKFFLEHKTVDIKFNYIKDHYDLSVDFVKFALDVSRCFFMWAQENTPRVNVLISNNKIYLANNNYVNTLTRFMNNYNNRPCLTFKNKVKNFSIEDSTSELDMDNNVFIVNKELINMIYSNLIILANDNENIRKRLAANKQETGNL